MIVRIVDSFSGLFTGAGAVTRPQRWTGVAARPWQEAKPVAAADDSPFGTKAANRAPKGVSPLRLDLLAFQIAPWLRDHFFLWGGRRLSTSLLFFFLITHLRFSAVPTGGVAGRATSPSTIGSPRTAPRNLLEAKNV